MNLEKRDVKKLESVLLTSEKIIGFETSTLTKPGDNFGSVVLRVDVKTKNSKDEDNDLHIIAKLLHPNEMIQAIFNCQMSFKNEIAFYKVVVPTLLELRKKNGLGDFDYFPKFYGGRLNINESDLVDMDAVILLENLKIEGYILFDKMEGFDFKTTKLILRNLANFQATSLALKQLSPKTFEEKIRPHLVSLSMPEKVIKQISTDISDVISEDETYSLYRNRLKAQLQNPEKGPNEPWACLRHSDLWVNNIMVKRGEITKVKFVDFQVIDYQSPIGDLIFFLFTSVQQQLLNRHLDEFLEYYHKEFIGTLGEFGCETSPFSKSEFEKELEFVAKYCELRHILMMCSIVFADKRTIEGMQNIKMDGNEHKKEKPHYSDKAVERMRYIVKVFDKRGWLE